MDSVRVFDIYTYNISDKVKFKDTKKYLDKMFEDLGLKYEEVSFTIDEFMTKLDEVVEKHPNLAAYLYYYERYRKNILTSLTPKWKDGEVYAKPEDWKAIFDVFSKIPRGFNVTGSVILHHIDWYGEGTEGLAIDGLEVDRGTAILCDDHSVLSNSVHMIRDYDDGNKVNRLKVIVEATTDETPRNTRDVIKRLEEYIGVPERCVRRCVYDEERTRYFQSIQEEDRDIFDKKIEVDCHINEEEHKKNLYDPFIPALVDRKMIIKSFADTGFSIVKDKRLLPGMNLLRCVDKHNFLYDVLIDRTQSCPSFFYFYMYIRGCNFLIGRRQYQLCADSREEAEQKLIRLAEYSVKLREEYGDYLAKRYGDTPEWYDWNEGDVD